MPAKLRQTLLPLLALATLLAIDGGMAKLGFGQAPPAPDTAREAGLRAEPPPRLAHDHSNHPCAAFKASLVPGACQPLVADLREDLDHGGHRTCLLQQGVVVPRY